MRQLAILIVATWIGAGLAGAGPETPGDQRVPEQQRADLLFAEGRRLVEAHRDAEACQKFGEAIKLDPEAAGTMLNLGLCNQHLNKFHTALYWFRKAQARAHETNLPDYERAAGEHTTELAAQVATIKLEIAGNPFEPKVQIDGEEVKPDEYLHVELDPGHHVLDASAVGDHDVHQDFDVHGPGAQTLTITFVDTLSDRRATRRRYTTITAITGGALIVTGTAIAIWARIEQGKCLNASGKPRGNDTVSNMPGLAGCPVADVDAYAYEQSKWRATRYVATPIGAAGLIVIGLAAYLYLTPPTREHAEPATALAPSVARDQLGLVLTGSF